MYQPQTSKPTVPGLTRMIYDMTISHAVVNRFNILSNKILQGYGIHGEDRDLVLKGNVANFFNRLRTRIKEQIPEWVNKENIRFVYSLKQERLDYNWVQAADNKPENLGAPLTQLIFDLALFNSPIKTMNILSDPIIDYYGLNSVERNMVRKRNFSEIQTAMIDQVDIWVRDQHVDFTIGYGYPLGPRPQEQYVSHAVSPKSPQYALTYCVPRAQVNAMVVRKQVFHDKSGKRREEHRLVVGGKAFPGNVDVEIDKFDSAGNSPKPWLERTIFETHEHSTWMHSWVQHAFNPDVAIPECKYRIKVYDRDNSSASPIQDDIYYPMNINNGESFFATVR